MKWELEYCHNKCGSGKGEFEYARGISVSTKTGNITIADISNKRIQVLTPSYEHLCGWNIEVHGCRLCPLDVHRVNDAVLAAVIEGHAVLYQCPDSTELKNTDVKVLHTFGNEEFVFPRGIITMGQDFVVSDVGKHRITVHNETGTLLQSMGSLGTDDATNFNWPYYMCTDDKGRLAVSDSHNRCVKLFDKNLKYIGNFGKEVLKCCAGVAYSAEDGGKFFVVEYDNKSLYEFSSDGRLIQCIDGQMPYPGQSLESVGGEKIFCTMHHGFFVYSK